MKTFKRLSVALREAAGRPILEIRQGVSSIFVIFDDDLGHRTEISLFKKRNGIVGTVTVRHLNRLGNANHAVADPKWTMPRVYGTDKPSATPRRPKCAPIRRK